MVEIKINELGVSYKPFSGAPEEVVNAIEGKLGTAYCTIPVGSIKNIEVDATTGRISLILAHTNQRYKVDKSLVYSINNQSIAGFSSLQIHDLIVSSLGL